MYSFYEKHGQKVLVVACILLMIGFLMPTSGRGGCDGEHNGRLMDAKIDGKPFTIQMYNQAVNDMQLLRTIGAVQTNPTTGTKQVMPLMYGLFRASLGMDETTYRQAFESPQHYYLLTHEAEQSGSYVSENIVEELSRQGVGIIHSDNTVGDIEKELANTDTLPQLRAALRRAFQVRDAFMHQMRGLKASRPQVDQFLAERFQDMSVRLVEFNASDFAAQAPAPTEQQLTEHFNTYSKFIATPAAGGIEDPNNPMGFGYLIPAKVKLQYIAVDNAAIRASIFASKTPFEWKEEAATYYQRNKAKYLIKPTSQPASTQPAAVVATSGPSYQTFAQVEASITEDILRPMVDDKRRAILNKISTLLQKDFQDASTKATTQAVGAVASSLGAPYGGADYLIKVSDDILRQFGIRPKVVELGNSLSRSDLGTSELKDLYLMGSGADAFVTLDQFLFNRMRDFTTPTANATGIFDLYQPLPIMENDIGGYIVRVTATEKAHPPASVSDVREKVTADVKSVLAFEFARNALRQKVDVARNRGLQEVAVGRPIFVSSAPLTFRDEVIPGYDENLPWARDLRKVCFELLRGVKSPAQLPYVDVVGVPRYGKVVMLEISNVSTHLDTSMEPYFRDMAARQLAMLPSQEIPTLAQSWFDAKNIEKRSNYVVPSLKASAAPAEDAPVAPPSPFKP